MERGDENDNAGDLIEREFEDCLKGAEIGRRLSRINPAVEDAETRKICSEVAWKIQGTVIQCRHRLYDSAIISLQLASSMLVDVALIKLQGIKAENHHCRMVCIRKFLPEVEKSYNRIMEMKTDAAYVKGSEQDRQVVENKTGHVKRLVEKLGQYSGERWSIDLDFDAPGFRLVMGGAEVKAPTELLH